MSDIATKIREYREGLGLSRADFGLQLGEKPSKIQDIETGKQKINDIFLSKFTGIYPVDLEWLFRNKRNVIGLGINSVDDQAEDFIQIKRYTAEASAGHGLQVSGNEGTGHYAFNQRWLDRRGLNANSLSVISVRGDSMEPDLYENDLLLLDHAQTDLKDSHIYALQFSEGLYVKRIQHLPEGQIHLISKNKDYPPITVKHPMADGIQIIGRVVASMHEW